MQASHVCDLGSSPSIGTPFGTLLPPTILLNTLPLSSQHHQCLNDQRATYYPLLLLQIENQTPGG